MTNVEFRVWVEFEFDGELHKHMEESASWFLLSQTGQLWSYGPMEPSKLLGEEYKKAIPLFYTGQKDKNGNKIFQGDLIQNDSGRICEVVWFTWCWDAKIVKCRPRDNAEGFEPTSWSRHVEVIGNIYENPELKEATK